jgi:3-oxoadipate enol-lactonase
MSVAVSHRFDGPDEAPVVVLSNSLGTKLEIWDEQVASLAERFRVLRYDQRGHGDTPAPPGPYSIAELAGDVLGLLDRLELERVSFCGLSIGGMTGLWLAINAPERIERLALCSSSAHMPPREGWIERAATVRAEGIEAVADAALERWFTPEFGERRPDALARVRATLLTTSPEGYAGCCEAIAEHDLRAELGRIRAPTVAIVGADDPASPPEHARLIREAVPGARRVVVERGRHLVNVERAEAVTRELLAHLTAREAEAAMSEDPSE